MTEFNQHWTFANTKLAPTPLIPTLPERTLMTRAQFATLQTWAVEVQIAHGEVNVKKSALLARFNLFTSLVVPRTRARAFTRHVRSHQASRMARRFSPSRWVTR